jgi:hypothetical protein
MAGIFRNGRYAVIAFNGLPIWQAAGGRLRDVRHVLAASLRMEATRVPTTTHGE